MNVFRISFGTWLLMFSLSLFYGNLQAQVWLTVKDGNTSSPYYTFKTPHHVPIDISTYGFERGQSYVFLPQGVSTSHPFMIGEHNGDMNSSLVSVFGAGGNPLPLTYNYSNLQISIPSNYNGDLVYFSTNDSSVHYHLKIVDPTGGNYQSSAGGYQTQGSSYQPVYDLNVSHLTALSSSTGQFAAKFSFFNDTNSSGSPEIRTKMMLLSHGQFQPDTSLGYYIAKPNLFPTIAHVYDYLTSINLSPINGYTPPLVHYQSPDGGTNNTPQYETQPTLMVDQSTSNTGIPYPGSGATWYQSFTAVNPSKLQKFAFVTNGAFTASATVKIREGEGVTGNVLHTGTWTGIGSNTNTYNEYVIDNDVVLTQGQKYTIQLENQTAGSYLGSNSNQYAGGKFHHSGYGGEYGDLKMKIWVLLQAQSAGGTIAITAPGNGSNADPDTDLTVTIQYASGGGGYQTPTWAYRIDSGFPGYGSPHGGTQVSGVTSVNNFLNGQANGNRQVNVALLDQAGNLHNPPVVHTISVNYQSAAGGYQTGGNGYQTGGAGYQSGGGGTIAITAPGNGSNADPDTDLTVTIQYASGGGGYQTPTWAYRIDSGFPGYGSPHGGTQVSGVTSVNDFLSGRSNGMRQVNVALLDQAGNLHNPPVVQTISVNYQSAGGNGYQTGGGGDTIVITAPGNGSNVDANTDLTVTIQYASGGGGSQTPTWAYRIDSGFPGYGSQHGGTQVTGVTSVNDFLSGRSNGMRQVNVALLDQAGNLHNPPIVQTIALNYQSGGGGYQTGGNGYQTPTTGYQTPGHGYQTPTLGYQTPGHGYQTPDHGYQTPSIGYQTPEGGHEPLVLVNQISQVRTLSHQILSSSILLTGELLDQNISAIHSIQVGFFISPSMQIATDDPLTQKVYAEKNSSHSFSANFEPGSHSILYFRAFAQSVGQTTLGNIRKISIEGNLNKQNQTSYQEALSILALDSVKEDGGWVKNPWFGRYKNFNNGWIYHSIHGWLYLASDNFNGIWAWAETRGWVWSNKVVYPFLYQSNIGNWIYVMSNDVNEVRYYNYSTNLFEHVLP